MHNERASSSILSFCFLSSRQFTNWCYIFPSIWYAHQCTVTKQHDFVCLFTPRSSFESFAFASASPVTHVFWLHLFHSTSHTIADVTYSHPLTHTHTHRERHFVAEEKGKTLVPVSVGRKRSLDAIAQSVSLSSSILLRMIVVLYFSYYNKIFTNWLELLESVRYSSGKCISCASHAEQERRERAR